MEDEARPRSEEKRPRAKEGHTTRQFDDKWKDKMASGWLGSKLSKARLSMQVDKHGGILE